MRLETLMLPLFPNIRGKEVYTPEGIAQGQEKMNFALGAVVGKLMEEGSYITSASTQPLYGRRVTTTTSYAFRPLRVYEHDKIPDDLQITGAVTTSEEDYKKLDKVSATVSLNTVLAFDPYSHWQTKRLALYALSGSWVNGVLTNAILTDQLHGTQITDPKEQIQFAQRLISYTNQCVEFPV